MTFDLHTHHNRCGHAHGSIRDYITAAVEKGMSYIGISDHTPFFAETDDRPSPEASMAKSEFPAYIQEVLSLKQEFAGQIEVLLGVEADFLPDSLDLYRNILGSYPLDYIIGSVHDFEGVSLYDTGYWERLSPQGRLELKESYYSYIEQSAKSGIYDILGHVDALNRYFPGYSVLRTEMAEHTLRTIAAHDIVIEINSSDELWVPDTWLLERALHYGVKVTFGSDAHEPARVGEYFEAIRKHLLDIGFREWAIFKNRERIMLPLER
ncbi:histidinol-phosphatase HisJ family protein [Paenibacillus sp. HJL G12]|uniref:Histidinol-phosphatase n=1 Tax=Paenibacillus dendrobii TaxID=2691084 RepID=A0A7X3INY5_9BACL|nr:histidinol-phosphatase [Paenibacillus dendrobii]MWV46786.1 histidinol-phosphatase HisJ family protein [Paenibacillus dendrobii]